MTISAVLLVGGKSRRMGQDKATMLFRGVALWRIQLELLRKIQPQDLLVSAQADPPWRPADVEFVADAPPSRGPLSGIAATLSRSTGDHLLVLGTDMPFMTESYLRGLCQQVQPGCGAVPVIENRFEPLAAIYPQNASPEFVNALSGDDFSLQPLVRKLISIEKLRPLQVSEQERALFRNLNELQDL